MATEPKSRRRHRKKILRKSDGSLFDATERRRITPTELREYVRNGGLFEARRQEHGTDCTYEVLQSVVGAGFLENLVPGLGGGGNPLAALGGAQGVANLLRLLGEQTGRSDWEEGWEEPSRKPSRRRDDRNWSEGEWATEPPSRGSWRDSDDWADEPASD